LDYFSKSKRHSVDLFLFLSFIVFKPRTIMHLEFL